MVRKRLGLSTEPQPVFVGGCFTLFMLLMQMYIIVISSEGNLLAYFNLPWVLTEIMIRYYDDSVLSLILWLLRAIIPVAMLICAIIYGKRKAKFLVIPSALVILLNLGFLTTEKISGYYISYVLLGLTSIFFALTAFNVIKTIKPFVVYCIIVCVAVIGLTALKKPPFTLFDGSIFISDLVYFVSYHLAVLNFAKAIPLQKNKI